MDKFITGFVQTQSAFIDKYASGVDMLLGGAGGYLLGNQASQPPQSQLPAIPKDLLALILIYLMMKKAVPDITGRSDHRMV